MNDQAFLLSLREGDPTAFKELVLTWQNMVFNTVLSIVQDTGEAEDIAQEVFVQVYHSIARFRGDSKLSTWIYRIAMTKALDAERKKRAKKRFGILRSLGGEEEQEQVFYHPGADLDNRERAAILFKAMRKLPDKQRAAFTLIKAEGLSYEETAAVMQLGVKAVESLMHRAKENLRKTLHNYYHDL